MNERVNVWLMNERVNVWFMNERVKVWLMNERVNVWVMNERSKVWVRNERVKVCHGGWQMNHTNTTGHFLLAPPIYKASYSVFPNRRLGPSVSSYLAIHSFINRMFM